MTEAVLVISVFAALLLSFFSLVPAAQRADFSAPAHAHERVRALLPCASPWQLSLENYGSDQNARKKR